MIYAAKYAMSKRMGDKGVLFSYIFHFEEGRWEESDWYSCTCILHIASFIMIDYYKN